MKRLFRLAACLLVLTLTACTAASVNRIEDFNNH